MLSSIQQLVSSLNYDWFQHKRRNFIREVFFDPEKGRIFDTISTNNVLPDSMDSLVTGFNNFSDMETEDTVIDFSLTQYCWNDEFPGSLRNTEELNEELPINGMSVSSKIIQGIKGTVPGINDVGTTHRIILSVIDAVRDKVTELLNDQEDEEYLNALDYFFEHLREDISDEFRHIKRAYLLSNEFQVGERLEFNLNQDQLGALLFILNEAGIFYTPKIDDISFLNFCQDRFYFRNQRQGNAFTKATRLRKSFNEAKNEDLSGPMDEIRERLQKAINNT